MLCHVAGDQRMLRDEDADIDTAVDPASAMGVCYVDDGLRERLGLDDIISVLQQNGLQWYGHVLRNEDNDWVKKCMEYEVDGARCVN